jgi:hypothetical protein
LLRILPDAPWEPAAGSNYTGISPNTRAWHRLSLHAKVTGQTRG